MNIKSKGKVLDLSTTQVMGILNVTPDSFSDGGRYNQLDAALYQVESMLNHGASIIDVGGESTRPGAALVTLDEELERVIPVVEAVKSRFNCWISVDTSKAGVMKAAVDAGADLINDVRALQTRDALRTVAALQVPVCIMHMQGQPQTMQNSPQYQDLFQEIDLFFDERIQACEQAGIDKSQIILDPGFGFGKSLEHNYRLLMNLEYFHHYECPILAGISRKSMIHQVLNKSAADVLGGSIACATMAALQGAQIIRVHDVKETVDAVRVIQHMAHMAEYVGVTQ